MSNTTDPKAMSTYYAVPVLDAAPTVTLNSQGKVSDADTRTVINWSKSAVALDEQMANELGSGDTWPTQKQKIVVSLAGFKLPSGVFPQELQALFAQVQVLVQQIQSQVSQ